VIDDAMLAIEANNASLKGVLPKDYNRPALDKVMLGELIDLISGIAMHETEDKAKDILGRVYEYFLGGFAGSEGKRGGEFYTPRSVVRVLVEMLKPYKGRVYDPCCGSGGMFVQSERFVEEHGGRVGDIAIYGQESNYTTWRLAKMNLAVRGIDADVRWNNEGSFLKDELRDLRFDYILANPPFNTSDWGGERLREDARWKYGVPPVGNANYAWLQHILWHLAPNGTAGVVLANGSMSSMQSGEDTIRRAMVEGDVVDCMIALPGQLFYSTQIPACLWFLARNKGHHGFRDMFRPETAGGFAYCRALAPEATPQQRLGIMAGAIEWVLAMQQEAAARETSEEGKKRAHRRYGDAALALSQAFALAAASDAARDIREEVGFFQAIRAALVKSSTTGGRTPAERELAIQQIVSRAVVSTEIVDIMQAAGIESPDISILSDDFLAEIRETEKKNLALEALRRLINGEVRSQGTHNVVQSRAFTERLEAAIARYHMNAITTVQVLEELIQLAKDIRAARERGEETGLNDEEIAFYDALAENQSARDIMGEPTLRVMAYELLTSLKGNLSVDWMHREAARARMRVLVKRILRKYGYPPDLQDGAIQTVLQQAEALSAAWTGAA
jgi:hypothetical protein